MPVRHPGVGREPAEASLDSGLRRKDGGRREDCSEHPRLVSRKWLRPASSSRRRPGSSRSFSGFRSSPERRWCCRRLFLLVTTRPSRHSGHPTCHSGVHLVFRAPLMSSGHPSRHSGAPHVILAPPSSFWRLPRHSGTPHVIRAPLMSSGHPSRHPGTSHVIRAPLTSFWHTLVFPAKAGIQEGGLASTSSRASEMVRCTWASPPTSPNVSGNTRVTWLQGSPSVLAFTR